MNNQNNILDSTKQTSADTKKYPIIIASVTIGVILFVTLITSFFVHGRLSEARAQQASDEDAYSTALQECGDKPYVYVYKIDPIEGTVVENIYYEPMHPNYESARQSMYKDILDIFPFDYKIEYECSAVKAQERGIERGE